MATFYPVPQQVSQRKNARKYFYLAVCFIVFSLANFSAHAQTAYCDSTVPTFNVNLVGNPSGTWISPAVQRMDHCCGAVNPDQCIQFVVTLDPNAQGISFDVASGAMPPGALFYQVNCGPPTPIGTPICLSGPGPHTITFCKPGNNTNTYSITSLPEPTASADIILNDGCTGILSAYGYQDGSINWTSIYPGPAGTYNSYLNCTAVCDTVVVTAVAGAPPFIDYQVCGYNVAGCNPLLVCDTVRVYFNPTLTAAIVPINPTVCFGNPGTTITAVAGGGAPPYAYQWSNGPTTSSVNVGPGNYTVTITDASNCPAVTATVTVTSFTATITANAGPDQNICAVSPAAQLAGSVTGVTTGIWSGGNGNFTPSNTALNATYTPTASEIASGQVTLALLTTNTGTCPPDTDFVTIFIHQFESAVSVTTTPVLCFGQATGTASAAVSGGNGPFTYSWNTAPVQTSSAAGGLTAGSYTVTVADVYGCTGTASATVTQPTALTSTGASTNVSCNAGCNGTATVAASGGTPGYSYSWAPTGGTAATASGLCAGTYTCTITDANGCTITRSFTITQPPVLTATIASTQATCNQSNGTATVTASGGTAAYTYQWSPSGGNAATATSLAAGNYSCLITDAAGCTFTATVNVPLSATPTAAITATSNVSCFGGANGSATVTASGGAGGYSYLWSPSGGSAATATGLTAGTYTVAILDANSCGATATVTITQPPQLTAATSVTAVLCNGANTGSASVVATGGTGGYSYSWNTSPVQTGSTANNIPAGNYTVTVTDANGCTVQSTAAVTQPAALTVNSTGLPANCFNSCDGQTIAIPSGGVQPYNFSWSSGCTQPSCNNVCAGSYTVVITDFNGCQTSGTATVTQPTQLQVSLSPVAAHCTIADGSVSATVSGGTSGYSYLWTPGNQTASSIQNVVAGTYSLTVTDAHGCSVISSTTVNSLPGVSAAISASTAATCPGSCDGTATVLASGGNGPYQYNWLATSQTTASATALCAATHSVVVTDSNGCQDTAVVAITEPAAFALSIATPPWLCIGQSATLTATVTGGTPAYTYNWSPSGPAVSPVTTTTYTLSVTDANGCVSATQTVTVNVHPPLSVTASGGGTTCTGTTVTLTASASGGNGGPYFYGWTPNMQAGSTVNVTPTTTTTYTVNVTDNCTVQQATATTQAFVPTVPSVTFSAVSPEGCANMCTQFTSNTPNGFSMLWHFGDGGTSTAANPTHCFTQDGSYTVTLEVTDGFGCTYTFIQPNMIIVHPNPVADFTLGPQPTTILEPQICFTSTSSPDVNQWYWNFGDVNDQVTDSTASTCHSYSDTGHYCVDLIVHNSYGCFSTVEYCLEIQPYFSIYVPNAFTPNSDGKNDAFMPSLYNVDPSSYEMQIFDRWGNLIFTTTNTGEGWDGRAKGKSQVAQIDTYVWKIFVRDYTGHSHALVGHVSIIK